MEKSELRRQMAALKRCHSEQNRLLPVRIMKAVEEHPRFQEAETVLLYHSLNDEVDTHDFIRLWSGRKRILLPVVKGDELELRVYTSPQAMGTGAYGIEEPAGEAFTDYASIGFIAVPGVAFDRQGHRLGRGKGYYDRLLPHIPSAYKAGICFPYQIVESVPTGPFDICMNGIITAI